MAHRTTAWMIAALAGSAMAAGSAIAQPQLINVSGSSLLGNFVRGEASTHDYIGLSGTCPPLLAPGVRLAPVTIKDPAAYSGAERWGVVYRVSGSVNGFRELVKFGYPYFTTTGTDDSDPLGLLGNRFASAETTDQWCNTVQYVTTNVTNAFYNQSNPGGQPYRAATGNSNRSLVNWSNPTPTVTPWSGGVTVDVAYLDVPASWGYQKSGAADATRKPLDSGYGTNSIRSRAKDGSTLPAPAAPLRDKASNALPTLSTGMSPPNPTVRNLANDPLRVGPIAANTTIFELPLTLAPIAPITNLGTGIRQMKMTELQWLFTTGRTINGENLVACTRDVGSGTRNGFMNSIGADPSFGVGDNLGTETVDGATSLIGPNFQPTQKGSTGLMLNAVRNHRLAVGYAGAETGVSGSAPNSWLVNDGTGNCAAEIIDTQNDAFVGAPATFQRPTLTNLLANDPAHWVIAGQAVAATIGDSLAEPVGCGSGGDASHAGNPLLVNTEAARYVNNIFQSITAFNATTPPISSIASPGEFLATNFILISSVSNIADVYRPTGAHNPTQRVANDAAHNPFAPFDLDAFSFTVANNTIFTNARYTAFNTTATGKVPTRTTGVTYSDNVASGVNYIDQSGSVIGYAGNLTARNKIAYDFNGDGVRTLADAPDMIAAWRQRNGGPTWTAPNGVYGAGSGQQAVIEILGDGNGDGSFTKEDVRYWADGLALNATGKLDRKAGFTAVDTAFGGNFFGTTKAGCSSGYNAGDSRADIYNAAGKISPGANPTGADGRIDGYDIDYIFAQMRAAGISSPWTSGQSADWGNISKASTFDLSADINGDLKVDASDVQEVLNIVGTRMGDVNLDGRVNAADRAIITAHLGQTSAGWAGGDINGDGIVTAADFALACPADFDGQNGLQVADIFAFLNSWFAGECKADFNGGGLAVQDIFDFLNAWFAGC